MAAKRSRQKKKKSANDQREFVAEAEDILERMFEDQRRARQSIPDAD